MKLYTDLDIVNGLSTCRDMFEAKAYLKANNIAISDQELELLQSQCNKINSERTLTIRQLNNVAGGMFSVEARRPEAPQYGGGTTLGAETHRPSAVRSNLAQYRVDPNSEACRKLSDLAYLRGSRIAMEHGSMEEFVKHIFRSWDSESGVISPDDALYAARAFDTRYEISEKKVADLSEENALLREENAQLREEPAQTKEAANADLNARIRFFVSIYGEFPDLSKVIPATPPASRNNSPTTSP